MSAIKQIEELFGTLDQKQQLLVIEKLVRRMRHGEIYTEESARRMREMANDPAYQEAMRAPYDED